MYYHAVPLISSRWHCMYGKCNVALWMMLLQPVWVYRTKEKVFIRSQSRSAVGHGAAWATLTRVTWSMTSLLLWGAGWILSPRCFDCIIIDVKKKEKKKKMKHICSRKDVVSENKIWERVLLYSLFPKHLCLFFFLFSAFHHGSMKKNILRNRPLHLLLAYCLLLSSGNHLEEENGGKKKIRNPVHETHE